MKNEVIHARISEDIKKESETILNNIGMTLSQSIDLFFTTDSNSSKRIMLIINAVISKS